MASLRLEKEGRQRSLKEQQRKPDDDDSEDNQSQISDSPHPGLDPGGGRLIIDGYKKRAKKLSWSLLLAYAAPMIGAGGMNFTLTTFAAYFYTDTMGLPPGIH
ncbi:transmembrane domain-containing protein, putative [Eimeria maxima]|uniref:Transmembrane domain-containing protein, putative n=1 Tax=Eimeria maxima TaxID=5804 RepID=U6M4Z8_EIMMA|nr:transmembrane domain-containing protein, putative [Eimeria maxima]CDJ58133.1 transmembrane domain-containing protein, putative [Eimeria maxima]